MEVYIYKCKTCGFKHQVPAYWVSFSPENTAEMPHMQFVSKTMCDNFVLDYDGQIENEQI